MDQIDHHRAAIRGPPVSGKIVIRLSHRPDQAGCHRLADGFIPHRLAKPQDRRMIAAMMAGKAMQPGAVDGLDQCGGLVGRGHHRLFDQHVPAARRRRDPVGGMKRCRGGDDHALCRDINRIDAGEIADFGIRMQVAVGFDDTGELAIGAVFDGADMAQTDQSGAHDEKRSHRFVSVRSSRRS